MKAFLFLPTLYYQAYAFPAHLYYRWVDMHFLSRRQTGIFTNCQTFKKIKRTPRKGIPRRDYPREYPKEGESKWSSGSQPGHICPLPSLHPTLGPMETCLSQMPLELPPGMLLTPTRHRTTPLKKTIIQTQMSIVPNLRNHEQNMTHIIVFNSQSQLLKIPTPHTTV